MGRGGEIELEVGERSGLDPTLHESELRTVNVRIDRYPGEPYPSVWFREEDGKPRFTATFWIVTIPYQDEPETCKLSLHLSRQDDREQFDALVEAVLGDDKVASPIEESANQLYQIFRDGNPELQVAITRNRKRGTFRVKEILGQVPFTLG